MAKQRSKAATPAAWVRIDPYTGQVSKKTKTTQPAPGKSFWERTQSPVEQARERAREDQIACPQCGGLVSPIKIQAHLRDRCPRRPNRPKVACEVCRQLVYADDLSQHRRTCRRKEQRRQAQPLKKPIPQAAVSCEKTGVFREDESYVVMYKGQVIDTAINMQHGWELLERYQQRVEQEK